MDVLSQSFGVSQFARFREDVRIESQDQKPSSNAGLENPTNQKTLQDSVRFHLQPGGLSQNEILKYFEENSTSQINQRLEELEGQLTKREDFDRSLLSKLFNMDDRDRERELRRLMRELDQADELERILFGEKSKASESQFELEANFEFKVSFQAKQSKSSSNYVDLSDLKLEARESAAFRRREVDPLVFDLNGDGVQTTGLEKGIEFDMDGDGRVEQSSFVSGDDFALALDRNGNGVVDSGKELFGDQNGASDGIEELRKYDQNHDGKINSEDQIYNELRLVNKSSMAKTLSQAGIEEIDLNRLDRKGFTQMGDRIQDGLEFKLSDGSKREALDVYFQTRRK